MKTFHKVLLFITFAVAVLIGLAVIALGIISVTSRSLDKSVYSDYGNDAIYEESYLAAPLMADDEPSSITFNARSVSAVGEAAIDIETEQRIIKTASLSVEVDNVEEVTEKITALTSENDGFVQSAENWKNGDSQLRGYITIRVPAEQFENTVSAIKNLSLAVENESISGTDVTEEYTDLEARLQNAQLQESELRRLLERAESVEDILAVQAELNAAREEVEVLQGRLNYLTNQTDYSTISVDLSEEASVIAPTTAFRPGSTIKEAGRALVLLFQYALQAIIWVAIVAGGILLPIILLTWLMVWAVRKKIDLQRQKNTK